MDKEIFLHNVRQQFIDPDDIELSFDSDFRKIESYDSLTGMTILVMLKDDFGVDITEAEYKTKITVGDLYEFVLTHKKP